MFDFLQYDIITKTERRKIMQKKKVAILISTYNGGKYLKEQLDSLLNQTYKNIDIYIRVDNS